MGSLADSSPDAILPEGASFDEGDRRPCTRRKSLSAEPPRDLAWPYGLARCPRLRAEQHFKQDWRMLAIAESGFLVNRLSKGACRAMREEMVPRARFERASGRRRTSWRSSTCSYSLLPDRSQLPPSFGDCSGDRVTDRFQLSIRKSWFGRVMP